MQNKLLLSLPIERLTVINAKYAMIGVWWFISYITYILIFIVLKGFFHASQGIPFNVQVTFLSFCFAYLLAAIFYPIHFKFGYRVASLVGILIFFFVTSGFGTLLSLNTKFTSIIFQQPVITVAIISLVITVLSYLISGRIFTKKDF